MDLDLTGKHALVCGGSDGIGRAAAHELALLGADVTVLARRPEALQAVVAALPTRESQQHGWIASDVSDTAALRAQVEALAAGSPVHILINNTGGPPGGAAHSAAIEAYLDAFNRHLVANQTLVAAVLPGMQSARWGRIVNVISTSVKEPIVGLGVSNTIRGAVASWAKTLSRELAPFGITVNNVLPGYTETGRITQIIGDRARSSGQSEEAIVEAMRKTVPAGRFAQPAEIAASIAFLASPAAAYVNGVSLAVDGGRMQSI
ncbi:MULTISPECIES: SDR family NAD(P)-dependent oxidoreductase [unclassified Lysobacter]|uniref:SDR family NAD(P)-dependent oxidoreductase n=1 Tax=unclassified Lysobacter TaxID=2635362 RepID=UPI0006FA4471|nr:MULTISPECIES: SDR family NAD(P)-dependent oxidoreductase [unclassified Lysobacter]KRC33869.1 short-chain dehydrogenase [Lysobacter sp. Root76]KRD69205.1 short-chain dehydrogenase [Lysobacter sp. Root96]